MNTVGLYSFPKSGNTWVRHILAALMSTDIEAIPDLHKGKSLSEAIEFRGFRFFKYHAVRPVRQFRGEMIDATHVIHLRRHPLDVLVSFLNYMSANFTKNAPINFESVESIAGTELLKMYLHTFIIQGNVSGDWTGGNYFESNQFWLKQAKKDATTIPIKYENLVSDPVRELRFLLDWLPIREAELIDAIREADIATKRDGKFFWRRKSGSYIDILSPEEVDLFRTHRGTCSAALGYGEEAFVGSADKSHA